MRLEMHQNRSMHVPKERQHDFLGGRLSFEFFLHWRGGMPPFHALSFALRIIVMHTCLVAGDNSFQDIRIFFIPSKELGRNLHALLLMHNSSLLGNPPCAHFPVSQIIMQLAYSGPQLISKCAATSDTVRYPSVFSNHSICPVDVVLCARC